MLLLALSFVCQVCLDLLRMVDIYLFCHTQVCIWIVFCNAICIYVRLVKSAGLQMSMAAKGGDVHGVVTPDFTLHTISYEFTCIQIRIYLCVSAVFLFVFIHASSMHGCIYTLRRTCIHTCIHDSIHACESKYHMRVFMIVFTLVNPSTISV